MNLIPPGEIDRLMFKQALRDALRQPLQQIDSDSVSE
jgi:hypothetical protein